MSAYMEAVMETERQLQAEADLDRLQKPHVEKPEERLTKLARMVVEALTPIVTAPGAPKRVSLASSVATAFRPFLEHVTAGGPEPKLLRDLRDKRLRQWRVSLEFWDTEKSVRIADSAGREYDRDTVSAYGGDVVEGLDEAAALVAMFATQIAVTMPAQAGLASTFQEDAMRIAFSNLRPALSRGGGHATMRRTSVCGRWHLICDVFKVEGTSDSTTTLP